MPSSSMRLTREASEKRGGGSVKCGETATVVVVAIVVAAFLIEREEAVELYDLPGGTQIQHAGARLGSDINRGAFKFGRFHLAGNGADPDQFIEPRLIGIEPAAHLGRTARQIGRTDRFMRLLGVLGLGLV